MKIKNDTSYLFKWQQWCLFSPSQEPLNFPQPLFSSVYCKYNVWLLFSKISLGLSRLFATRTFLLRVSYEDVFSMMVFLFCHVPGCHERALLDTVSRSRCEPHASNPGLRFAYYTPNHLTLNSQNQVSHFPQWCFISTNVSPFTRKKHEQTCGQSTLCL